MRKQAARQIPGPDEVAVEGTTVAQGETRSSEMAGTVTGKEISRLGNTGAIEYRVAILG